MPEVICNTSPVQYLHQLGQLHLLPALVSRAIMPPAVVQELEEGRRQGIDLPSVRTLDWIEIRSPASLATLRLVTDLGPGETEVLALGMESAEPLLLLDDALARRVAHSHSLPLRGTLGLLLDAKKAGLIPFVEPLIDQLHALRFRVSEATRTAVLEMAGEIRR